MSPGPRTKYRPDIYVTDKNYRAITIVLSQDEYAALDKKAKVLNLARGTVAKDLLLERLGREQ